MTPEQEVLSDLLVQARVISTSAHEAMAFITSIPATESQFAALTPIERIATTALLKEFEQLQDTVNGLFRATLRIVGLRLKGLFPLDIARRMEELDILDDPARWVAIVKLRNELVHEYPGEAALRLQRLSQAHAALPFLFDAAGRVDRLIRTRGLLEDPTP